VKPVAACIRPGSSQAASRPVLRQLRHAIASSLLSSRTSLLSSGVALRSPVLFDTSCPQAKSDEDKEKEAGQQIAIVATFDARPLCSRATVPITVGPVGLGSEDWRLENVTQRSTRRAVRSNQDDCWMYSGRAPSRYTDLMRFLAYTGLPMGRGNRVKGAQHRQGSAPSEHPRGGRRSERPAHPRQRQVPRTPLRRLPRLPG